MKKEFNHDHLYDKINDRKIPEKLEFYFGGSNLNFLIKCKELRMDEDNTNFVDFISLDFCNTIFFSKPSIHSETGKIYYDGLNTNKSIFDFFRQKKNKTKN